MLPWDFRKKMLECDEEEDINPLSPFTSEMAHRSDPYVLLNRIKRTNPEKFANMVKMHLSFILDFNGATMEKFLDENQSPTTPVDTPKSKHSSSSGGGRSGGGLLNFAKKRHNKEMKAAAAALAAATTEGAVFGVPLTSEVTPRLVPLFECLSLEKSLSEEGLFRKSGNLCRQRSLRERLVHNNPIDMSEFTAHDCAVVLKAFLAELPEPLLPEKHYKAYLQLPGMSSDDSRLATVQLLVQLLPRQPYLLLKCLLNLLDRVTQNEHNKMTCDALGTLFAPTILAPRSLTGRDLHNVSGTISQVVSFMIRHAGDVCKIPDRLLHDIQTYWDDVDELPESMTTPHRLVMDCTDSGEDDSARRQREFRKRLHIADSTDDSAEITTTVMFADRQASQKAAAMTDTETEVAKLYAHLTQMPESAKKQKLIRRFNEQKGTTTPNTKHKRTRSFGESIKKMVGRGGSSQKQQQRQQQHAPCTPVSTPRMHHHPQASQFSSPNRAVIKKPPVTTPSRTPVHRLYVDRIRPSENPAIHMAGSRSSRASSNRTSVEGGPSNTTTATSASNLSNNKSASGSPLVHIVDMKAGSKRKATDSPMRSAASTQTSFSMLSNYVSGKTASSSSSSPEQVNNKENSAPQSSNSASGFMSPPPTKITVSNVPDMTPSDSVNFSKHRALIQAGACEFSPISKSVTKAPKSVQQSVATPGSRLPMALPNSP